MRNGFWIGFVVALALPVLATAGSVDDTDGDGVPDAFDNCLNVPNGPNDNCNQVDPDMDGYGVACDPDYNQDGAVNTIDCGPFFTAFNSGVGVLQDHNCDGVVNSIDFATLIVQFNLGVPGPSGLPCAGTPGCKP